MKHLPDYPNERTAMTAIEIGISIFAAVVTILCIVIILAATGG